MWSSMQHSKQLSTIYIDKQSHKVTHNMVTRKPLPLEGKPEGSRTPCSWVYTMKAKSATHTRGHSVPNSTLSTYRLVAALTLCSLVYFSSDTSSSFSDWTSTTWTSNRKNHRLCNWCVCEWNEFNSINTSKSQGTFAWINQIELTSLEYDSRVNLVIHKKQ